MVTAPAAASQAGDNLNKAWKNDKSKFGLKMLQKMGWTEGKGLGKNEDGVSEHVKVSKKSNNLGLGATHDASGAAGWASAAMSFNGVLEALGKAYGSGGGGAVASGRDGKKRDRKAKKKARKEEKRQREENNSNVADSRSNGDGDAVRMAKAASSCPSRARRVRSKDVKGFSSADLRAILGHAATTTPAPANPSLPTYPVIGGGCGPAEVSVELEPEPEPGQKAKKKKSSSKKSRQPASAPPPSPVEASHRPLTRSMDETANDAEKVVTGKRSRKESQDFSGEGERERVINVGGEEKAKTAEGGGAVAAPSSKRCKSTKKSRRAEEGSGESATVVMTSVSKDNRKQRKKIKKEKGR